MRLLKGDFYSYLIQYLDTSFVHIHLCYSVHSNERLFLRDFVGCVSGTSGGRLAQWLQPGSRVDPSKCHVVYSRDELRCGWPAIITVLTCDQYSDVVHVPNMKVSKFIFKKTI